MSKQVPYTTKAGVKIGIYYVPPRNQEITIEEERIQSVLLGVEPQFSQRKVLGWTLYIVALVAIFSTIAVMGAK